MTPESSEPSFKPSPLPPDGGASVPAVDNSKPVGVGPADAGSSPRFEDLWDRYPRKSAEARARRQWVALGPDAELLVAMLAALDAQMRTEAWQREGGRYVPLLSTWLHGKRWLDRVEQAVPDRWWRSSDGIKAMGEKFGMPFSRAALGNAYTDDQSADHWRAYVRRVFEAAGDGPWSERRAA